MNGAIECIPSTENVAAAYSRSFSSAQADGPVGLFAKCHLRQGGSSAASYRHALKQIISLSVLVLMGFVM